jgi:hypothetical protein
MRRRPTGAASRAHGALSRLRPKAPLLRVNATRPSDTPDEVDPSRRSGAATMVGSFRHRSRPRTAHRSLDERPQHEPGVERHSANAQSLPASCGGGCEPARGGVRNSWPSATPDFFPAVARAASTRASRTRRRPTSPYPTHPLLLYCSRISWTARRSCSLLLGGALVQCTRSRRCGYVLTPASAGCGGPAGCSSDEFVPGELIDADAQSPRSRRPAPAACRLEASCMALAGAADRDAVPPARRGAHAPRRSWPGAGAARQANASARGLRPRRRKLTPSP